jgi:geranylgeranyl diphosphate synthase type I
VAELQQVISESGAREAVEGMITDGYERAMRALQDAEITAEGRAGLTSLAEAAVRRDM